MKKKFADFFTGYGMEITGNSAYGTVNGYETNATLDVMNNNYPLRLHISFYATDEQKHNIQSALRNAAIKYCVYQLTQYGLMLGLNDMTTGRLLKRLPSVLDTVYGIIGENGGLGEGSCPVCGNILDPEHSNKHNVEGLTLTLDDACVEQINAVIDKENEDFKNAPNNYLLGFCGALIGAIVGVGVSIAFYAAGFISSISAIISVLLGAFLFEKFHGKPNKMMIVIVAVTTLVFMLGSYPVMVIVDAGIEANKLGLGISAMDAFDICMSDSEFKNAFYRDLALIFVFAAVGIGVEIAYLMRKIKRTKNIK
ncbi:MAG: hypothetical protein K2O41_01955 [Clostridia bacterium]|nr:hypothetical protein [Clostridia bacterium]